MNEWTLKDVQDIEKAFHRGEIAIDAANSRLSNIICGATSKEVHNRACDVFMNLGNSSKRPGILTPPVIQKLQPARTTTFPYRSPVEIQMAKERHRGEIEAARERRSKEEAKRKAMSEMTKTLEEMLGRRPAGPFQEAYEEFIANADGDDLFDRFRAHIEQAGADMDQFASWLESVAANGLMSAEALKNHKKKMQSSKKTPLKKKSANKSILDF